MEVTVITPFNAVQASSPCGYVTGFVSGMSEPEYKEKFALWSDLDKHVILVQDVPIPPRQLVDLADEIGAKEIAIGWIDDDAILTLSAMQEFMLGVSLNPYLFEIMRGFRPRICITPVGSAFATWRRCVGQMVKSYLDSRSAYGRAFPYPPIIGINESFLNKLNSKNREIAFRILYGYKHQYKCQLHLWNWSGDLLELDNEINENFRTAATMKTVIESAAYMPTNTEIFEYLNSKLNDSEINRAYYATRHLVSQMRNESSG